jgi:hypothetical protein
MAANTNPIYPLAPKNIVAQLTNASGTNAVIVYTAGANGARIDALSLTNSDTVAHDVALIINNGSTDYTVGTFAVAIGAGTASTIPAKAVLSDSNITCTVTDPFGNKVLYLQAGYVLKLAMVSALASTKVANAAGLAGDF